MLVSGTEATHPPAVAAGRRPRVLGAAGVAGLAPFGAEAKLRPTPGDGHISVLNSSASAMAWLAQRAS